MILFLMLLKIVHEMREMLIISDGLLALVIKVVKFSLLLLLIFLFLSVVCGS